MTDLAKTTNQTDAVCIGFGPAGIALACAYEDLREAGDPRASTSVRYFEQAAETHWHPELLLAGADINHHVFRDLVTPRNPRSRFSFAMYLKAKSRMFDFGLLGRPASRHQWSDYVRWVAGQVDGTTQYAAPVQEIVPIVHDGMLDHIKVLTPQICTITRNLILSSGSSPFVPELYQPLLSERVFHTAQFLSHLKAFGDELPQRWLVVGSGQSASESVQELLARRRDIHIRSIHRSAGFRLAQLGQFPNRVFSPDHVDYFHSLSNEARRQFLDWSKATNYAGIDPDESQKLFSTIYEDALAGRERLVAHFYRCIDAVERGADGALHVRSTDVFSGCSESFDVDAIVLATGYEQLLVPPLLAGLQPWLRRDSDGGLLIDREYRVAMEDHSRVHVFVNGLSERSHGISDGQSFSLMALRAECIVRVLDEALAHQRQSTAAYQG